MNNKYHTFFEGDITLSNSIKAIIVNPSKNILLSNKFLKFIFIFVGSFYLFFSTC